MYRGFSVHIKIYFKREDSIKNIPIQIQIFVRLVRQSIYFRNIASVVIWLVCFVYPKVYITIAIPMDRIEKQ